MMYAMLRQPRQHLTDHELEILRLVAAGYTYDGIGEQLGISRNTVKNILTGHEGVDGIYRILGVHCAPAAVAEGFRRGLLT